MKTYDNVAEALAACENVDEVRILHPETTGIDAVRAIVHTLKYLTEGTGGRALIIPVECLSPGATNALDKACEETPPHARFLLVAEDRSKIPPALKRWIEA